MSSASACRPESISELSECLAAWSGAGTPVRIRGAGSKAQFGPPPESGAASLDLSALAGIVLYQPDELVLTARAGTPVESIRAALAERRQCLAFDPPEFGLLYGNAIPGTLGGAVATGLSGPRRVRSGAVRDHVLGATSVGGDGQTFRSGGRVVKNVTGFDLPKLLTGSHGTLAALVEITIKVSPAPEIARTLAVFGLDDRSAVQLMSNALGGPYELSGATHLQDRPAARSALGEQLPAGMAATLFRLEGFGPSVSERLAGLERLIPSNAPRIVVDGEIETLLWRQIRDVAPLIDPDAILWRLSVPATDSATILANLSARMPGEAILDWGGNLVWLAQASPETATLPPIRGLLPAGHAILMRAPESIRRAYPVLTPRSGPSGALARRIKQAFDPAGILAPDFFQDGL